MLNHKISRYLLQPVYIISLILVLFIFSCGKKGAPTLASYEKPETPAGLNAVHVEDRIVLQWSFPKAKESGIVEFVLLKSSGSEFVQTAQLGSKERSYTDKDFREGNTYNYKVVARSLKGILSDESNVFTATPVQPPLPPQKISFSIEDGSVVLSWNKTGNNTLYNIYKTYEKGKYGFGTVNKTPISENTYKDSFNIQKPVFYTIRSLLNNIIRDEGPASEEVVINPQEFMPSQPRGLQYFVSPDAVYLYWDESAESWITRYRIYRKMENQEFIQLGETQIPAFADREPPLSKRDYRVVAVGPEKEGPFAEVRGLVYVPEP